MNKNYLTISFDNISDLRSDILLFLSTNKDFLNQTIFFYVNVEELLLKIKKLNDIVETLKIKNYIKGISFSITNNFSSPIHIDTGEFKYSLNIPIENFNNTYISFYKNQKEPIIKYVDNTNITMNYFNDNECQLIEKIETINPAFVNTQVPHKFESFNVLSRIMMMIRLDPLFDPTNLNLYH